MQPRGLGETRSRGGGVQEGGVEQPWAGVWLRRGDGEVAEQGEGERME